VEKLNSMSNILHRISVPFIGVAIAANAIGTIVIFLLVGIMNVDIVSRGAFNAPLRGVVEVVIFSLVLIVDVTTLGNAKYGSGDTLGNLGLPMDMVGRSTPSPGQ
jgi:hypothetical protein